MPFGAAKANLALSDRLIQQARAIRHGGHGGGHYGGGYHGGVRHGGGYGGYHGGVRHAGHGRWGAWARPGRYWWRPGGAIAAGAAIGFVTAATAAAWAGAAPGRIYAGTIPIRAARKGSGTPVRKRIVAAAMRVPNCGIVHSPTWLCYRGISKAQRLEQALGDFFCFRNRPLVVA
jgi:hypothetical protein